ncbi:MAG: hypothetical protein AAF960_14880 [Bacteroidota bacterium]
MKKVTRILFLLVGSIFPIVIGALHTGVHFKELINPEIRTYLQKEFLILGTAQPLWKTWGIVSFMMGASFIIIGLLNIAVLKSTPKVKPIPTLPIIAVFLYQCCVTYVGYEFSQPFQLYGGLFGLSLIIIVLILTLQIKS